MSHCGLLRVFLLRISCWEVKQQIPHWNIALVVQALLLAVYSLLTLGSSIVMAKARRVKINDVVDDDYKPQTLLN